MAQVSYGTITITDTNDIERIYTVYAKSTNNATVPSTAAANWSESVSTAPGIGSYIWQRTVVEKSGTGEKTYSDPVCLTGEEGEPAKNIVTIETQYGISANWNTEPSSWSADTPSYDSSKPDYWVRNRLKYEDNTYSNWVVNKDYALTQAVYNAAVANSIAQNANENANGAMSQAAENVQSITRLWYATSTHTKPSAPSLEITSGSAGTYGSWSTVKPTATNTYRYFYYCDQSKTGGGVVNWSEVIEDTSYLSTYEINALDVKTRNFFKGKDNTYDGWFASGRASDDGLNEADATTYYYNARFGATHITLGYNKTPVIDLDGGSGAIKLYSLPTINSSTHLVTTAGKLGMQLTSDALSLYGSSTSTPDAILNSNGLKLTKGGIKAGEPGQSGFIYLSTIDYPLKDDNASPNPITGLTINGYTPTAQGTDGRTVNDPAWRAVIGDKFGVDSEGNLYASSATIKGVIKVENGSNVYNTDEFNETIYGVITYQYDNNGNIETVYKKNVNDEEIYYYIDSDGIEQEVNKSNLEVDSETNELITVRINGLDTLIDNIAIKVDNNQDSISLLQNNTTEELNLLAQNDNIINERLSTQLSMQSQRLDKLEGYIIIDSNAGFIQVGDQNGNSYVKIDGIEAMVSINTNEKEKVAYISEDRFYAPSAVVTNLYMKTNDNEIGAIGWVMRSNGHLSLKRIK